jgi:hypothetical protein
LPHEFSGLLITSPPLTGAGLLDPPKLQQEFVYPPKIQHEFADPPKKSDPKRNANYFRGPTKVQWTYQNTKQKNDLPNIQLSLLNGRVRKNSALDVLYI